MAKELRKSGQFDREFYRQAYGPDTGKFPELHYLEIGEALGFRPRPDFCPREYFICNPDTHHSAFWHFLKFGRAEGRQTRLRPVGYRDLDFSTLPKPADFQRASPSKPTAVALHLFHHEMWEFFETRLSTAEDSCDFFITFTKTPANPDGKVLGAKIADRFPSARVFAMPNHGRDLFPFLCLVQAGAFAGYEAVCKLHSKKSPHLEAGHAWRDHLVDSVVPAAPDQLDELVDKFLQSEKIGTLTATGQIKEGDPWWHGNRFRTKEILRRSHIPINPTKLRFPAGSIYWLKPAVIDQFRSLKLSPWDFELETGQPDGTAAHALERAVGFLTEAAGLRLIETGDLMGNCSNPDGESDGLEFCEPANDWRAVAESPAEEVPAAPPFQNRFRGIIDECSPRGVVGWVRDRWHPERRWWVRLWIDETLVSREFADQFREDVAESSGGGDGYHGFALPLPAWAFDGRRHAFRLEVEADARNWEGLAFMKRLPDQKAIGRVESTDDHTLSGWCLDPVESETTIEVDLYIDGYFIDSEKANQPGERGDHDFRLEIPERFRDENTHAAELRIRGSGLTLWEGTT